MQLGAHCLISLAALAAAVSLSVVDATYYCHRPQSLDYGGYNGSSYWYSRGSVIEYYCDDGYTLQGNLRRTCCYSSASRAYYWSGSHPSCVCKYMNVHMSLNLSCTTAIVHVLTYFNAVIMSHRLIFQAHCSQVHADLYILIVACRSILYVIEL